MCVVCFRFRASDVCVMTAVLVVLNCLPLRNICVCSANIFHLVCNRVKKNFASKFHRKIQSLTKVQLTRSTSDIQPRHYISRMLFIGVCQLNNRSTNQLVPGNV